MRKPPGLLIIVDPGCEHLAVAEAKKLNIPVMALIDTNCDPDPIDYVIACNDDALKSIKLILNNLTRTILEKKKELKVPLNKEEPTVVKARSSTKKKVKGRVEKTTDDVEQEPVDVDEEKKGDENE
jgi:small subunit ribosomal protein S2